MDMHKKRKQRRESVDDFAPLENNSAVNIQWFPGHMAKTKREMEKSLKMVDVVGEILDARIPLSSQNPVIKSIIQSKARIVLLNKADVADPRQTEKWIDFYKSKNITAIALDCRTGRGLNQILPACKNVLSEQIAAWNRKGMVGRAIRIMVVGVPNVGKSSLINKMCQSGKIGKADVQDRPGVTRQNRWFTIGKGFELLDTPGVLWPKFEDPTVGERLAFTGAVKDDIIDIEGLACRFLEELMPLYPSAIKNRFNVEFENVGEMKGYEMLEAIGKKRSMLISGGEIDTLRAAIAVLDEFRAGKLGRITLDQL